MKTLVILYMLYLSWGTEGQGRESILALSRYLRVSKTKMRRDIFVLADEGLVDVISTFTAKGSEKLMVQMTEKGEEFFMARFDAAIAQYHQHVAETIMLINERSKDALYEPKKLSKKQREAIAAGQKELF